MRIIIFNLIQFLDFFLAMSGCVKVKYRKENEKNKAARELKIAVWMIVIVPLVQQIHNKRLLCLII